jgi:hypothetical protein
MSCQIEVPLTGDPTSLLSMARQAVESMGGTLSGTTENGTFELRAPVALKGTYRIDGQRLLLVVDEKPLWVTCGMIESRIRGVFTGLAGTGAAS